MAQDAYPSRETEPEIVHRLVRIEGQGASNPIKERGSGVSVTRINPGRYRFEWAESPGHWVGLTPGLEAPAAAVLNNWSVISEYFNIPADRQVTVVFHNELGAETDLPVGSKAILDFRFANSAVTSNRSSPLV